MAAKNPARVKAGKKAWRTKVRKYGKARAVAMIGGKGRGKSKPRKTPTHVGGGSTPPRSSKPGYGAWAKIGRTADVFSGPAQFAINRNGFTQRGGEVALEVYSGGLSAGAFHAPTARTTAGSIALGLARDWIRSKMGVYRGVGQKKALSIVMAANPEILATSEQDPTANFGRWNALRTDYDRAYDSLSHTWDAAPTSPTGSRFWRSVTVDGALAVFQKVAEKLINPILPAGYNL